VTAASATKDPKALWQALQLSGVEAAERLGAFTMEAHSSLSAALADSPAEELTEDVKLEIDAKKQFHLIRENSRQYGYEIYFLDNQIYFHPRYERFEKRPAEGGEQEEFLNQGFSQLAASYEVLGRFIALKDLGTVQEAGRSGRKIGLILSAHPAQPPTISPHSTPDQKWRDTVQVSSLSGFVVLDEKTAVLLHGELKAHYSFLKEGKTAQVDLNVTQQITAIGLDPGLSAPTAQDYPMLTHYEAQKAALLQNLSAGQVGQVPQIKEHHHSQNKRHEVPLQQVPGGMKIVPAPGAPAAPPGTTGPQKPAHKVRVPHNNGA